MASSEKEAVTWSKPTGDDALQEAERDLSFDKLRVSGSSGVDGPSVVELDRIAWNLPPSGSRALS
jgi:hypothetical protein